MSVDDLDVEWVVEERGCFLAGVGGLGLQVRFLEE
jgi:hypothetical protein